ncbi:hypothetical protein [Streptomyces sp. NPDC051162]|uniref:hypothetical protein n=1 Tax=unclassified Streptomyces TaxID=2593676 RepID=UPI003421A218
MNRLVWWASLTLIGSAAAGTTAWSLFVVAHDIYGVPALLAAGTSVVFDGAAIACLHLAGEATKAGRSAFGPHCATLGLAGVSVYLNHLNAVHIHGGTGAFLLFAMPTVALLLLAGLAWSATRARLREEQGERPLSMPRYGLFGWLLASEEAWKATKHRAVTHVTGSPARDLVKTRPVGLASATERLRVHFAGMDTAEAIRFAHSARPAATPQELADDLALYGINVTPVGVALVLGFQPPTATVERSDAVRTTPDTLPPQKPHRPLTSADILSGQPDSTADAARQLISLGITDKIKAVPLIIDALGLDAARQRDSVRRAFDREMDKHQAPRPDPDGEQLAIDDNSVGKGGGGYV